MPTGVATDGRVIYDYQIGELEGKLLTLIDSLGFDENREKATKDLLKGFLRQSLYCETRYVFGEFLNEAIKKQIESSSSITDTYRG